MFPFVNTREQGDLGEFAAMRWLVQCGASVFIPLGHSPDIDLVADLDGSLVGVQVKTATSFRNERWEVRISTCGGNQSWSGVAKQFAADRCDALFVLTGDGRQWFIPSTAIESGHCILLGGPKYAEFEVESGDPILSGGAEIATLAAARRDSGAVKRARL